MLPAVHLASTELVLATSQAWTSPVFLGQSSPSSGQNGTGAEFGKSAPIGLVIILILLVALILLIRSMNRHVRKMPESFDLPATTTSPPRKRAGEPDGPNAQR